MGFLDWLERKIGRFALPNLTLILVIFQVVTYLAFWILEHQQPDEPPAFRFALIPAKVLEGEVWRLASFLVMPPTDTPLFAVIFWLFFLFIGTMLESHWGTFRYNVYLLIGWVATAAAAFFTPQAASSNAFLEASVFFAFACLSPEFEVLIFFMFPVRVKWLALIAWIVWGLTLAFGDWPIRVQVLASICNFLVFFGPDLYRRARYGGRRLVQQMGTLAQQQSRVHHKCLICGATDRTDPDFEFRYCSQCAGDCCYCMNHLRKHEHVRD